MKNDPNLFKKMAPPDLMPELPLSPRGSQETQTTPIITQIEIERANVWKKSEPNFEGKIQNSDENG